ncbi:MAG: ATP F0F1 synthase subunit B [Geminicoccaceae bacterium]|jgi:F-type H+-transporting ATPase subunit b|nr:F0F1 ATP synthase subunit B [Geminicoccaceae bacterium]MCB9966806.1 ATP F0F1 synthase subunit B [Geminicoccaceae bacterium]HRY23859.1 F0F1 ATP synthase subunit B [Geminicoccaceae bacterium]
MIEFWLLVALAILIALVWKPFRQHVLGGLDARSDKIRAELEEAKRLHEEAKQLLARHQRQLHEGESLAADIRSRAAAETKRLETQLRADFEQLVQRRTKLAEERIAQEEARAVADVRARAAELAVATTRRLLTEKLGGEAAQRVMQNSIREVTQKLG